MIPQLTFSGRPTPGSPIPPRTEDISEQFDIALAQYDRPAAKASDDKPVKRVEHSKKEEDNSVEEAAEELPPVDADSPPIEEVEEEVLPVEAALTLELALSSTDEPNVEETSTAGLGGLPAQKQEGSSRQVIGDGLAVVTGAGKAQILLEADAGAAPPVSLVHAASDRAQSPQIPLPDQQPTDSNVARVARGLQNALQQKGGTVMLRLHPPELGVVRIEVSIREGSVSARFQTETESVRQLLTHQIRTLRSTLEGQGLHVDRLQVQTLPSTSATNEQSLREETADGRSRGGHDRQSSEESREGGDQPPRRHRFMETLVNLMG